jgi:hypothetical protein
MKKFLRWCLRITVGLAVCLVLFHLVENWRGKRAWASWKASREALGESFEWAGVVPAPVPDDENFAKAPVVARSVGADFDQAKSLLHGLEAPKDPEIRRNWRKGEREDLQAWVRANGAKDLDALLKPLEARLKELDAASRRSRCRLLVDYSKLEIPVLPGFRPAGKAFRLRALQRVSAGDGAGAMEDVLTILRIAAHLEKEPQLISALLRRALVEAALQPIWEGLGRRAWNEAQLLALHQALAGQDELASFRRVLQGERVFSIAALAQLAEAGPMERARAFAEMGGMWDPETKPSEGRMLLWLLAPRGWIFQNMVSLDRSRVDGAVRCLDVPAHRIFPDRVRAGLAGKGAPSKGPYSRITGHIPDVLIGQIEGQARTQAALDLARIAIALERHRLAKGAYPRSLEELKLSYLAAIPVDVCDGQPLRYRLESDGRFALYSVGWNGKDDGGGVVLKVTDPKQIDFAAGDWIWPGAPETRKTR